MSSKIVYRPDIDGLRALAVLSVIIFHLNTSWLPGGFLGVDIFFVISGYLITSIIYPQIENGTFSFSDFYNRRIKRILPLFFIVLLVGLGLCAYIMLPQDSNDAGRSAFGALFFAANIYFARGRGYFDAYSEEKPFLHLWSLSVEEQYYFIFPIVLFVLFRFTFFRRNSFRIMLGILFFLLAISFIDIEKMGLRFDRYYQSHLRFIEIFVGSLLAIMTIKFDLSFSRSVKKMMGIVALSIMLCLMVYGNHLTPPYFPGVLGLIPALATAVFIFANSEKHWVSDVFSSKVMVWIGKISYSLYLWHWVVLALFRYVWQESELPMGWIIVAVILTFGLSIITYYLIENPIRSVRFPLRKSFTIFYILPAILVLGIFFALYEKWEEPKVDKVEVYGDISKKPKILVIGDSHAVYLTSFINSIGKSEGWSSAIDGILNCPFSIHTSDSRESVPYDRNIKKRSPSEICKDRNSDFFNIYSDYEIVVIVNFFGQYEFLENNIEETIKILLNNRKKVYIINSSNKARFNGDRIVSFSRQGNIMNILADSKISSLRNNVFYEKNIRNVEKIKNIVEKYPQVKWIDLTPYLLNILEKNNYQNILFDDNHFTENGSELLAEEFIKNDKILIAPEDLD